MKKLLAILVACLMPICLIAESGDVNGDGEVDVADIVELLNYLNKRPTKFFIASEADVNKDGVVNTSDLEEMTIKIMKGIVYYQIPSDYLNGWDGGISSNSTYFVYKEAEDGLYYYLNDFNIDNEDGLLVILNENGSITGIVHQETYFSVLENDSKLSLFRIDEDGIKEETIDISRKTKVGTRATPESSLEYIGGKLPVIGQLLHVNSINNDMIDRNWDNFLSDVGDIISDAGIGLLGWEAGLLFAAPFEMIRMEGLQHAQKNARVIYNDCSAKITDISKGTDGRIEVYVTVSQANSMRQYIPRNYYPETLEETRNDVYCGVVGRSAGLPTTNHYTKGYNSQEEKIPTDGSVSTLYLSFFFPDVPAGQTYTFRPYLKSTRIKNIFGGVDQVYIRYGNSVPFGGSVGTIVDLNTTSTTCSTDVEDNVFVYFDNWITARLYSNEGINEWGVFFDTGKGNIDERYPTDNVSKVSGFINIPLNFFKKDFDKIDKVNFVATKLVKLGVYQHQNNPTGNFDYLYWQYSVPQEFELVYDKKPVAKTLNCISSNTTSAVIRCSYDGSLFWGVSCGLEYSTNDETETLLVFPDHDGEHEIHITELTPNTTYTCRAYYEVNGKKEYGESIIFTTKDEERLCPDSNHPHWIDLGLPSGTLWRCCNEGASKPEAYGGRYTFGQVTSAPTQDQLYELRLNCTQIYKTLNGVNGYLFTGHNGGKIFLPATGCTWLDWDDEFVDSIGHNGYYLSSTPYEGNYVYGLYFNIYNCNCPFYLPRTFDLISFTIPEYAVRPVRQKNANK